MSRYLLMVGWPKCGTSSLFTWLAHHPAISAATPKETFFLMDADHPLVGRHGASLGADGPAAYDRFFADGPETTWRLDATTHHVFQAAALEFAQSLGPQVHVVFTLRDPTKRLRSSFEFTQNNLAQIAADLTFESYLEALMAGEADRLDRHFSDDQSLWILKRELEYGRYLDWIAPWRGILAPEQMSFVLFEDIAADPDREVRKILGAIELDAAPYGVYDYPRKNETLAIRNGTAQRVARAVNRVLPGGASKAALKSAYLALFTKKKQATLADTEAGSERARAQAALQAYYQPHNADLAAEFALDLAPWGP